MLPIALALPPPPEPIAIHTPQAIAQVLVNPANPQLRKDADIQRAAFNHVKAKYRLGRGARVWIDRFHGSAGWAAAQTVIQMRPNEQTFQVIVGMRWDDNRNQWLMLGVCDSPSQLQDLGIPAEEADFLDWSFENL